MRVLTSEELAAASGGNCDVYVPGWDDSGYYNVVLQEGGTYSWNDEYGNLAMWGICWNGSMHWEQYSP